MGRWGAQEVHAIEREGRVCQDMRDGAARPPCNHLAEEVRAREWMPDACRPVGTVADRQGAMHRITEGRRCLKCMLPARARPIRAGRGSAGKSRPAMPPQA